MRDPRCLNRIESLCTSKARFQSPVFPVWWSELTVRVFVADSVGVVVVVVPFVDDVVVRPPLPMLVELQNVIEGR